MLTQKVLMRALLVFSLIAPLWGGVLLAQTYTLSGKVSDAAGNVVAGAKVSTKSVANGKTLTAETGSDGMYWIPTLQAATMKYMPLPVNYRLRQSR